MASTSGGWVNRAFPLLKSRGNRKVISTQPMYIRNVTFNTLYGFFFFFEFYVSCFHVKLTVTTILFFSLLATLRIFRTTKRLSSRSKFQTSGRDNNFSSSFSRLSHAREVSYSCLPPQTSVSLSVSIYLQHILS